MGLLSQQLAQLIPGLNEKDAEGVVIAVAVAVAVTRSSLQGQSELDGSSAVVYCSLARQGQDAVCA